MAINPKLEKAFKELAEASRDAGYMFVIMLHDPEDGDTINSVGGSPTGVLQAIDVLKDNIVEELERRGISTDTCDGDCDHCHEHEEDEKPPVKKEGLN